jgi:SulP family sulfate permease
MSGTTSPRRDPRWPGDASRAAVLAGVRRGSSHLGRLLPGPRDYQELRTSWAADLTAGVTVAVVALPLALAFGVASGVGAAAGLVTAVVAGVAAAVLGGSHLQVSGPTGAMAVVLLPIVALHGAGAVAAIAVLAGLIVVLAGVLGLGRLLTYLPWPVVEGFTLGIAVVIAAQQVPVALGVPTPDGTNASLVAVRAVVRSVDSGDVAVVGLLVLAIALMAGLAAVHRSIPAALLAVGVVTAVAELARLDVARIGALPQRLPAPSLPDLSQSRALLSAAVAVAALAALESLLSARVADGMTDHERHDSDRELVGQGLANVAAGLFGGLPATGALARTAVNVRSGARTRLASVSHALVLAVMMAALSGVVSRVPLVALAGVLLVTAARMVDRHAVTAVLRSTRTDALVLVLTAGSTIVLDLVRAVEIGIVVAVVVALVRLSRTAQVVDDTASVLEVSDPQEHELLRRHVLVYRIDGPLFFAATTRFLREFAAVADVRVVVLRLANLAMLDASGAKAVAQIVGDLQERHVGVVLKVANAEHTRLLRAVGALQGLEQRGQVLTDLPAALEVARALAAGPTITTVVAASAGAPTAPVASCRAAEV